MADSTQCSHYALEIEDVAVPAVDVVIQIPIRRCALAERLVMRLEREGAAAELRAYVVLAMHSAPAAQPAPLRVALGPDLEPITRGECTASRCAESCTPGYHHLLAQYGVEDSDPSGTQECTGGDGRTR